jgi:hypothetical protein
MPASKGRRIQNSGRVILGLVFYGTPVVIAITVGLNGYIVDMNWQSWKEYEQITKAQRKLCKR